MAFKLGDGDNEEIMAEINMTPLIDIMLVLLIIFMVTSSISLESGLDVDLPDSVSKGQSKEGSAVVVSLLSDGRIAVQGTVIEKENLGNRISEALATEKTELVILEGDQASRLGMAVEIMDIAKAAGAVKFAIATEVQE
ncbi:MAG: biopolymer transporter ExbD [Deltaproteobacteria bacterium]|nr:MAG: biopolymer transporter ExbD [Deltaproteobacteria bacterium]